MAVPINFGTDSIPPPPFRMGDSGVVQLWQGGGCMAIFGIPFFLSGILLALIAAGFIPVNQASGQQEMARPVIGLMSLPFLIVGGLLVFGRSSLDIDLGRRMLLRRYWLLAPIRSKERCLDDFNGVVIGHMVDSDGPDSFPITLRARAGPDYPIYSPAKFGEARVLGEFLCRFLHLPLIDTITDHATVVTPERSRESLAERLRSANYTAEMALRPPAMHCDVREFNGQVRIGIPKFIPRSAALGAIIPGIITLIVTSVMWHLFTTSRTPPLVRLLFMGFVILTFGIFPLLSSGFFSFGRNRTVVTASPAGIEIQPPGRRPVTTLPARDIIDLDYLTIDRILESARSSVGAGPNALSVLRKCLPNKGIVIKSRQELVTFGEGLPAEELKFLVFILKKALAGG